MLGDWQLRRSTKLGPERLFPHSGGFYFDKVIDKFKEGKKEKVHWRKVPLRSGQVPFQHALCQDACGGYQRHIQLSRNQVRAERKRDYLTWRNIA